MGKICLSAACMGLLVALAGTGHWALRLKRTSAEFSAQLEACRQESQDQELVRLLEDLCLPPAAADMDTVYRRTLSKARLEMFQRQERDTVPAMGPLTGYPPYWADYEQAPIHLVDVEKTPGHSLARVQKARVLQRLSKLAGEFAQKKEMGLYLWQRPNVWERHVRPLVMQLLQNLSPDGRTLLWRWGAALCLLDIETQTLVTPHRGHLAGVRHISVNASTGQVGSLSWVDFLRWDSVDGAMSMVQGSQLPPEGFHQASELCLASDGTYLVAVKGRGRDCPVEIRDIDGWTLRATLANGKYSPGNAKTRRLHPNGTSVAIGYGDGTVSLWDLETETETARYFAGGKIGGLAFSGDGATLACWTETQVWAWPTESTNPNISSSLCRHPQSVQDIVLTRNGDRMVILNSHWTGGDYSRIVKTKTGKSLGRFFTGAKARNLAISPDDRLLAIGFADGRVQVHSAMTGEQLVVYRGHRTGECVATFTPDSRALFTGGADTTILKWRLPPHCRNVQ